MESNSSGDGRSHILHTFDWFDNELHMQIGIDDIGRLCKFFTAALTAAIFVIALLFTFFFSPLIFDTLRVYTNGTNNL